MISLVWGHTLAPIVSAMVVAEPGFSQRLVLAPRRVINSVAAYIHHAIDAEQNIEQIAREIEAQDVRVLLSNVVTSSNPRLYRMLDRVGPTALDLNFYQRLDAVLTDQQAICCWTLMRSSKRI
jgi:hypothetical protein